MCSDSVVGIPTGGTIVQAVPSNAQVETGIPRAQQGRLFALSTTVEPLLIARWKYPLFAKQVENIHQHRLTVKVLDPLRGWHRRKPKKAVSRYATSVANQLMDARVAAMFTCCQTPAFQKQRGVVYYTIPYFISSL